MRAFLDLPNVSIEVIEDCWQLSAKATRRLFEVLRKYRPGILHLYFTGFLNLTRANADVTYVIDNLPEPHPIFRLIQNYGGISDEEMFFTYNMGIGFCVVVAPEDLDAVRTIAHDHNVDSHVIGHTVSDPQKQVRLPQYHLLGSGGSFRRG